MNGKSEFLPNSYQKPNAYVDRLMAYLTPAENVVLDYMCRRIFGFNKRQDRIGLGQFTNGIKTRDGEILDEGTGISRNGVINALTELQRFNIVLCVDKGNAKTNTASLYELQLDSEKVDWRALRERRNERKTKNENQTNKARKAPRKDTPIFGGAESPAPTADLVQSTDQVNPSAMSGIDLVSQTDQPYTTQQNTQYPGNTVKTRERAASYAFLDVWKRVTGYHPPAATHELIYSYLGSQPDEQKLKKVFTTWIARDYKPRNIEGILEWYQNGIPDRKSTKVAPLAAAPALFYDDGTPVEV